MKQIIFILTILLGIIFIYLLRKNKKIKHGKKLSKYREDSDWNKVKEIPVISCIQCGECVMESNGCCANCNVNSTISEEFHCKEHDHKHSHHSPEIPQKLIIFPILFGIIIFWTVKNVLIACRKFWNKNKKRKSSVSE